MPMDSAHASHPPSALDFISPVLDALRSNVPRAYLLFGDELLTLVVIFLSVVIFIIAAFVAVLLQKRSKKGILVITGPTSSGKTVLFYQLQYEANVDTVMSLEENRGHVAVSDTKRVDVVDLPGHERLRYKVDDTLCQARAVIFTLDAAKIAKDLRTVAEYLYDVLAHRYVSKSATPILVACNMSDAITAYTPERVRKMLESEIDKLRSTRTAALDAQDSASSGHTDHDSYLGYEGQPFSFDDVPNPVDFEAISGIKGDLDNVRAWVADVMR